MREGKEMTKSLAGQVAIVTAAAHGIGHAIAQRLARDGATLAVVDHDEVALKACEQELGDAGARVGSWALDCTDQVSVASAYAEIEARVGRPEILINVVGSSARERSTEFYLSEPQMWRFVVDTSLMSGLMWAREVAPGMRERQRGRIVNISSDSAHYPQKLVTEYAAAKAGVVGFTRGLAVELAPFNVTVNAVSPGFIATRSTMQQMPRAMMEQVLNSIPMGRSGTPDDIAGAVAYLVGPDGGYVTGQTIRVNGGRTLS
jgi:NAD(P)-dependent dehydrogenase (short-subunit alcohol dehydrogenase family)